MSNCKLSLHAWGLALIFLLSLVALEIERTGIEEDLRLRSQVALHDADIHWAWVSISGRDVFLHGGEGRSQQARQKALKAVADVYGVRKVKDVSKLLKRITPYIWTASRKNGRLKLSKHVLSHDEKQIVLGIANALMPGLSIEDKMSVALGANDPENWLASVNFALQQLRYIEKGYVTVTDKGITVRGRTTDADNYLAFLKNIEKNKPKTIKILSAQVVPPKVKPYSWAIAIHDGKVVLDGHVPDLKTRKKLLELLEYAAHKGPVVDNLVYASGQPKNWSNTVQVIIKQFCSLDKGIITLSDKQITVSGYVKDGLSLKEVEKKLLASLPKGFSLKNNVKVREQDRNNEPAQDNQVKLHNSLNNF